MSKFHVSWWDRFLMGFAPDWGLRRVRARAAVAGARHYDAAGGGRRTTGWHGKATDANAANFTALSRLRDLSRDLRRNNGWARRGIRVICVNTVGWGISAKPVEARDRRKGDALWYWDQWSRLTSCDHDGRLPFSGLQRLVMETVVESGECLIQRKRAPDGPVLPFRIRILEPDYLDTTKDGITAENGNPIVQGIEFNKKGQRVAYWLFSHHPGSTGAAFGVNRYVSERVPAEDIIHVYRMERPGQARGVPWLASAIAKIQDFDDYDDAVLMQAKIASCFGAFVKDLDGASTPVGEEDADNNLLETLEPGHIQYLNPGQDVSFAQPPSTSGDHATFSKTLLRRIAASLDVTYEDLTGDYSQVNFSSARMARLAHWSSVEDWRWNMLIPQFCDGVWKWAMEAAGTLESWAELPRADWAPPPMPMIEPDKEGLAYSRLIRAGVMTLPQALLELGRDPGTHLQEIADTNKQLDELGIVLDCDPRKTSQSGLTQQVGSGPAQEEEEEEAAANGSNGDRSARLTRSAPCDPGVS